MKKCKWCGAEIEDSEKFCLQCKKIYHMKNVSTENQATSNVVSTVLKVIGCIVIAIGVLVGWLVASDNSGVIYFFIICCSGLISGVILIAFGEVIKILHEINKKIGVKTDYADK